MIMRVARNYGSSHGALVALPDASTLTYRDLISAPTRSRLAVGLCVVWNKRSPVPVQIIRPG
jgi:hypothetical protein